MSSGDKKQFTGRTLTILVLFVAVLLAGGMIWYGLSQKRTNAPRNETSNANASVGDRTPTELTPAKPEFSWQGTVATTEAGRFTASVTVADAATNSLGKKTVTVVVTGSTTILEWDVSTPERAAAGGTAIPLSAIHPNDTVTFQSDNDVDATNEITATKVNRIKS